MADWLSHLHSGEKLRWEGRPAPRCYTFRHWRFSLAGTVMLVLLGGWQGAAVPMGAPHLSASMVLPIALCALVLLLGLPLRQRLAWEGVFYAITDHRLLIKDWRKVNAINLATITSVHLKPQGEELGTLRVARSEGPSLILPCLEYPRIPAEMLKGRGEARFTCFALEPGENQGEAR